MTSVERLKVFDPTIAAEIELSRLAPRLDSLDGKVIGLYNNGKPNAARLLEHVGEQLRERYPLKGLVRGSYSAGHQMPRAEWSEIEHCDAIVLANGD